MSGSMKAASQPVVILLVDDDEDCRGLIHDAIESGKLDNTVYEVSSGEEAMDFLHRRGKYAGAPRPGLIYLDIEMPGMGGQATLKAIRTDPRFSDVAVVMMTGISDDSQKIQAMQSGANSYTVKPTDPMSFIQTVLQATNYWIRIHQFPTVSAASAAG